MSTTIHFVGQDRLDVDEDADTVNDKIVASHGGVPVALTKDGDRVYVIASNIIHWADIAREPQVRAIGR